MDVGVDASSTEAGGGTLQPAPGVLDTIQASSEARHEASTGGSCHNSTRAGVYASRLGGDVASSPRVTTWSRTVR